MTSSRGEQKPPILDVMRHYGHETPPNPKRSGWSKIRCPFPGHEDKNPSASVNLADNKVSCHACAITMDSWQFIMEEEGVGYVAAKAIAEARSWGSGAQVHPVRGTRSRLFD